MHPLNKLLVPFGIRVVRTRPKPKQSSLRLGNYEIELPPESRPIADSYQDSPHYNTQLTRLARRIYEKYPTMMAVDIGANVGDTVALIRTGCPSPIVAIEGDDHLIEVLTRNVARVGDVRVTRAFLSDRIESRRVQIDKVGWNSTLTPGDGLTDGSLIAFLKLDDVLDEVERATVRLVKIDTEGYEAKILRGGRRLLSEARPVVLFEYNREVFGTGAEDGQAIFRDFQTQGYRSVLFWDERGRFLLFTSLDETSLLADLHDYIAFEGGRRMGDIQYLDVAVFHEDDEDLAEQCVLGERSYRVTNTAN